MVLDLLAGMRPNGSIAVSPSRAMARSGRSPTETKLGPGEFDSFDFRAVGVDSNGANPARGYRRYHGSAELPQTDDTHTRGHDSPEAHVPIKPPPR